MNELLLFAIALFSLPFAAGGNSVQVFHCESEGCAADVAHVYCNDVEMINNRPIANCCCPPTPGAVCQHDGRAFVSISGDARCEFEGNGGYIKTKKCTDLSNICISFRATTPSPVTSRGQQNTADDLTGLIVGVAYSMQNEDTLLTPPGIPSPPPDEQRVVELSEESVKNVKLATVQLLILAIQKFRRENCYGCQVNHPSQIQHECLWPVSLFFFDTNYEKILKILWTDRFIPAIRLFLCSTNLWESHGELTTVVNNTLCELKASADVDYALSCAFSSLVSDDDCVKNALLNMIGNFWGGNHVI